MVAPVVSDSYQMFLLSEVAVAVGNKLSATKTSFPELKKIILIIGLWCHRND